jgi:hypothetical protein
LVCFGSEGSDRTQNREMSCPQCHTASVEDVAD